MRRRWKALVAVGAVALLAGLFLRRPHHDDGLDWIRKYGGRERKNPDSLMYGSVNPVKLVSSEFTFKSVPRRLLSELKEISVDEPIEKPPTPYFAGTLPDGYSFTWEPVELRLTVGKQTKPSWLDLAKLRLAGLLP
jgi:hypothetical protein